MWTRALFALAIAGLSGAATAQTPCPLPYKVFEFAVPHLDLEECPKDLARKGAFCRMSAANDHVHVFVFAEGGDQCLLAVKSYGEYRVTVK